MSAVAMYLSPNNKTKLKNDVFTTLIKEGYNTQPLSGKMNEKFEELFKYVSENVELDFNAPPKENLNILNDLTTKNALDAFRKLFASVQSEELNGGDVDDLYARALNERDYSQEVQPAAVNSQTVTSIEPTDFSLPPIVEESPMTGRRQAFVQRLESLRQGRMSLQDQRNLVDLETRDRNYRESVLGEVVEPIIEEVIEPKVNEYVNSQVENVGRDIVSKEEIDSHRYDEYKKDNDSRYRKRELQIFINAKDRQWIGELKNGKIQSALEPYRYRFQLTNKEQGIYLQNRHRNITSIRVTSILINNTSNCNMVYPYLFLSIPELEQRIETSLSNRKYVFSILTLDDKIGNQVKYDNFLSRNEYFPNPLSELGTLTFEILNPMGTIYNNEKDDIKISSLIVDNVVDPEHLVINLDKMYLVDEFSYGETLIVKKFGFEEYSNDALVNYMNREEGHIIKTPSSVIGDNKKIQEIYIELPKTRLENGDEALEPCAEHYIKFLSEPENLSKKCHGGVINLCMQPTIILEVEKLDPNSKHINLANVDII